MTATISTTGHPISAHAHDRANLDRAPAQQRQAVMSAPWLGQFVLVYGNNHDGWREWGGGYRMRQDVDRDAAWLNGGPRT